eukprot:769515-Prymnesium_polylepis.1
MPRSPGRGAQQPAAAAAAGGRFKNATRDGGGGKGGADRGADRGAPLLKSPRARVTFAAWGSGKNLLGGSGRCLLVSSLGSSLRSLSEEEPSSPSSL